MTPSIPTRPLVLCILDGWGCRTERADNGIAQASTPNWRRFLERCPSSRLQASELYVGLPRGQMGNSEVGHMNIGAGRVVMQDLPRIDSAIADGSLSKNHHLTDFIVRLQESGGTAHLLGLLSPGGVHSHQNHIAAIARLLSASGIKVAIHAFLDGRDTPPQSAESHIKSFLASLQRAEGIRLATLSGRFYAMDRDRNWERVAKAYNLIVDGKGTVVTDPFEAIDAAYQAGQTDEFIEPIRLERYKGMQDGDGLLCANFRADRVREILTALLDPEFSGFVRERQIHFAAALGLSEYSSALAPFLGAVFPQEDLRDTFGEVVARAELKQLRIAETEKYAHVTFFFNGGRERVLPGEDRILVPSPKVPTYDLKPEMSAFEVTEQLVRAIDENRYDVIVVNYANPDMVGHTGILSAAIKAAEAVDTCLGRLAEAIERAGGTMLVTADHGNIELMRDPETGEKHTAHTLNPVPLVLVNGPSQFRGLSDGRLADIAPTLLQLLGLPQPVSMTGRSLLLTEPRPESHPHLPGTHPMASLRPGQCVAG